MSEADVGDIDTDTVEEEHISGRPIALRGPFKDGTSEMDVETLDGELVTITMTADQLAQLLGHEPEANITN